MLCCGEPRPDHLLRRPSEAPRGAAAGANFLSLQAGKPVIGPPAKAPRPWNEAVRVQYLRSLGVLDTVREPALDDITQLCGSLLGLPWASVHLVDREAVIVKACAGPEAPAARTLPRDTSLCSWVVAAPDAKVLVIPDTTKDARFRAMPYVTAKPFIRFYAGAPLVGSNGLHLGTLCVLDTQPRELDAGACNLLANLASLVVRQLEAPAMQQFDRMMDAGRLTIGRCGGAACALR